jgi:tRNA A-37 threonylcarbamoyl transferase component Bud32
MLPDALIALIHRQVAWIQAAFGAYPDPSGFLQPFHEQGWEGCRDPSFPEDRVREILSAYQRRDPALSVWHQSRHRTTYRMDLDLEKKVTVFLKHYGCRRLPLYNPRSYLRWAHARKSFRLAHLLVKTGIPTAKVLFYLRENRAGVRSDCLLATEEVSNSPDLKSWMKDRYPSLSLHEKEAFAKELARFLATLHRNGICHGDFESNTLVSPGPYRFCLIDLESVRTFGSMLNRDRKKQLATLFRRLPAIGADDQIRQLFLQTYFSEFGMKGRT